MNDPAFESDPVPNDRATAHPQYLPLIAKGAGVIFAGIVIGDGLRYLFQVVVARFLGVELFGIYSLGFAAFHVGTVMAVQGMGQGVVRYVSLYCGAEDQRRAKGTVFLAAALSLGGGILVALSLMALSEFLATDVFRSPRLTGVFRSFSVAIPFFALTTVFLSSTQALRIMKYRVYVRDLFEPFCRIVLVLLAFLLGWQLGGVVAAFVVSIMAGTLLGFLLFSRVFSSTMGPSIQAVFQPREFLVFCWPLFLASTLYFLEVWIPTFMLGRFATARAVGVFTAVYKTALLVQGILLSFSTIFAPIISDLHHKRENSKLESLFKTVSKWVFSLSLPAVLLLIVFSQEILSLFGPDFPAGATSLIVLSIGQLVTSIAGPVGIMISMSGRSKVTLFNSTLHLLLQTGLCYLWVPLHGVLGAALASAASIVSLNLLQLLQVRFILGMHPFRFEFLKPLAAGVGAWLAVSLAQSLIPQTGSPMLRLVLKPSILLIVYGLALYRLGFDNEDKAILQRIKMRLV